MSACPLPSGKLCGHSDNCASRTLLTRPRSLQHPYRRRRSLLSPPCASPLEQAFASLSAVIVLATTSAPLAELQSIQSLRWQPPVAALPSASSASLEDERGNPFTVYGSTQKKYVVEVKRGEKVLARRKGITATTCVTASDPTQEDIRYSNLATVEKVAQAQAQTCSKAEAPDLPQACANSCQTACSSHIESYASNSAAFSGFALGSKDKEKVGATCIRNCVYECNKPGSGYGFTASYRK